MNSPAATASRSPVARRLTGTIAASAAGGLLVTALVVLAAGATQDWWRAWSASAATLILSILLTLPILAYAMARVNAARMRHDATPAASGDAVQKAVPLVLVAGMVRMVVFAAGAIVSVRVLGTPRWPTFGFITTLYFVLAGAEVAYVGRAFWNASPPPGPRASPVPDGS